MRFWACAALLVLVAFSFNRGRLAADWWDPKGSSAMLHKLNPVRLAYIRDQIDRLKAGGAAVPTPVTAAVVLCASEFPHQDYQLLLHLENALPNLRAITPRLGRVRVNFYHDRVCSRGYCGLGNNNASSFARRATGAPRVGTEFRG